MKKILLILFLIISISAQSQILITLLLGDKLNSDGLEFGLEGGLNLTRVSGMETNTLSRKWNLGFYFDIRIKNQWSVYTGVLVKSNLGVAKLSTNDLTLLGASVYEDSTGLIEGDYSHKMNTFLVPVLMRYKFKNHIFLAAGPQFGLMYKSWIEFESEIEGRDAIIKEYNKDLINKIDVGATAAIGYQMWNGTGWSFVVKYYYGFVDVYKDIKQTKNSSIFFEVNIPIGAGEKPAKK